MKAQRKSPNRISALPQDLIEKILTLMPICDAVRTSILSKKWRYHWASIPKLVFDVDQFDASSGDKQLHRYKLANAIFHVLLLRRAPIFEFSLIFYSEIVTFSEIDQILLHLSIRNTLKKFNFGFLPTNGYLLPRSFFSMQGLEHLELSCCVLDLPLANKGFSKLKRLHFLEVSITSKMLFKFLTNCPLLEEFTWIRDKQTYIELTGFELVKLFKCLPSVQVLEISNNFYNKHLAAGSMPHKLPISLVHLRVLVLGVCFLELSSVVRVMSSSPNLEKIKMEMCREHDHLQQTFKNLSGDQDYTRLSLVHLKEVEITNFHDCASWMGFVKFIMAKSPVLKKTRIELDKSVSVDEENKMLRGLLHMPFPRASPAASFIIERPKV